MKSAKILVVLVLAVIMAVFATTVFATPLPSGTLLVINPGVSDPADPLGACIDGSCFSMYTNGTSIWTNFGPGTDGGIIVGKDQVSGGQEVDPASINDGELSNAWSFFGSPGSFYTSPGGGAQNKFDNVSCTGAACIGKTVLAVFNVAWNGNIIPMGSAAGCTLGSCTPDQKAGIFVSDWQIDGIAGTWSMSYSQVVPSGGFANVPFSATMRGTVDVCADALTRCDDKNVCTTDSCDPATGNCIHTNNTLTCNDNNACTTNDRCVSGVCTGTAPKNCADNNPCTDDSCNPATGLCIHVNNTLPCNDNNLCTTNDTCSNGICKGTPMNCDDGNVCTTDTCSAGVCYHTPACCGGYDSSSCPPANPLPAGTKLAITPGVGSGMNVQCSTGSCFSMGVAAGVTQWTDLGPGTDGGIVVGKSQTSGGQELGASATSTTPGQLSNAWSFFSDYGTFFTMPDGGTRNIYDSNPCAGASCIGKTELKVFNVAWNGNIIPLGSAAGCTLSNCTAAQKEGIFVNDYQINSATGAWSMNYNQVVPSGSFTNVPFGLIIRHTGFVVNCATMDCNDNNVCTTDTCDSATGCVHTLIPNCCNTAADCNDNNACTTDTCVNNTCVHKLINEGFCCPCDPSSGFCDPIRGCPLYIYCGNPCDDNNACTTDSCTAGVCVHAPISGCNNTCVGAPNGLPCNDGNACTTNDVCMNQVCVGTPVVCTASDQCHVVGACNPSTGACSNPTVINGTSCDDNNACTLNDTCSNGACAGTSKNCSDNNPCTTDTCNAGVCAHTVIQGCDPQCAGKPDSTPCSLYYIIYDPSVCHNDYCSNGVCVKGKELNCNDNNVCTTDTCMEAYGGGFCVYTNNTLACSDNNACTVNDVCSNGTCKGTSRSCDDGNCCTTDSCDPTTGVCVNTLIAGCGTAGNPLPAGTKLGIDQGNGAGAPCTSGSCFGMEVQPGYWLWTDFGPGTDGGFVVGKDQANGQLSNYWSFFGNDGTFNTTPSGSANLFDKAPCSGTACVNKTELKVLNVFWNGMTIPMGSACGVSDYQIDPVNGGWSMSYCSVVPMGDPSGFGGLKFCAIIRGVRPVDPCAYINCNDGNVCTDDSCLNGVCIHTNNILPCNDGNGCTVNDTCSNGICKGTPMNCDDGNVCTTDSCVLGACLHVNNTLACNDNNACTVNDVCSGGVCAGTPINCNDNNACTADSCAAGVCQHAAISCDDSNDCTTDSCNPATGCVNTPIPGSTKSITIRGGGQKPSGVDLQIQTNFTVQGSGCIVGSTASSVTVTPGTALIANFSAGIGPQPTSCTWNGVPIDMNNRLPIVGPDYSGEVGKLVCDNKDSGGKDVDRMTISVQ